MLYNKYDNNNLPIIMLSFSCALFCILFRFLGRLKYGTSEFDLALTFNSSGRNGSLST
jgi:hypothetical protein